MKKIYTMNREMRNFSIFGIVCVNSIHLISKVKHTILLMLLYLFIAGTIKADYNSKSNLTDDYESTASWNPSNYGTIYPATNGNANQAMTINSGAIITRTGDLNPVTVTVKGTFTINGNYTNNQWGGLIINNGGKVEIFGNLSGSAGVDVKSGGVLIVHGNFASTGSSVSIKGDMVVLGNYSTSSETSVNGSGNLVVGGNFSHLGGGLNIKSNSLYITNPDAIITNPGWGAIQQGNFGNLQDLISNESNNAILIQIIEQIGIISSTFNWLGTADSNWFNAQNWNKKAVPSSSSEVVIDVATNSPVINSSTLAQTGALTINAGALLKISAGGKLTVNNNLIITEAGGLSLENQDGENGMASIITKGTITGSANIKLTLPKEKWFYVSSAISGATLGNFSTGATGAKVYVYRGNKWFSSGLSNTNMDILPLEGSLVKYVPLVDNTFTLNYTGVLNNDSIERTFTTAGWYLFGNPYPSFINWQDNNHWSRPNIEETIWFRTKIGEIMTFITYNKSAPVGARSALSIGSAETNETELSLIPPMQSVWIKVSAPTTISVNNNIRTHGITGSKLKSAQLNTEADVIRITSDNNLSKDGTVVYFDGNATDGLDKMDSEKRFNDSELVPEVYTRIGNTATAINGLTQLDSINRTIALSVRNKNNSDVTLTFNLGYFKSNHLVELEDIATGALINLRETPMYKYTPTTITDVHNRFLIHITYVPIPVVNPEENGDVEIEIPTPDDNPEENVTDSTTTVINTDEVISNSDTTVVNTDDTSSESTTTVVNTDDVTTDSETTAINTEEKNENASTAEESTEISQVSTSVVNAGEVNNNDIAITGMRGRAIVTIKSELLDYGDGRLEIFSKDGRLINETYTGASTTLVTLPGSGGDAIFIVKVTAGSQTKSAKVLGKQ